MSAPEPEWLTRSRIERRQRVIDEAKSRVERARHDAAQAEAQATRDARKRLLAGRIPLTGNSAGIVLGTLIDEDGELVVPLPQLQHMLVAGVAGAGKSLFLHSLVWQCLRSDQAEKIYLTDLKNGVEFDRYRDDAKAAVVDDFSQIPALAADLVELMAQRYEVMKQNRWQNWRGGRVFVVIDEYAEIQNAINAAETREEKATAKQLEANLLRLAQRARAAGVVLVCALQKPTQDAMHSSIRANLGVRICFRMANHIATSVLDGLDGLPVEPCHLKTGRFIYYNSNRGITAYAKAQIAPGVELAEDSW